MNGGTIFFLIYLLANKLTKLYIGDNVLWLALYLFFYIVYTFIQSRNVAHVL